MKVFGFTRDNVANPHLGATRACALIVEPEPFGDKAVVRWHYSANDSPEIPSESSTSGNYANLLTAQECLDMAMALLNARTTLLETMESQEPDELGLL